MIKAIGIILGAVLLIGAIFTFRSTPTVQPTPYIEIPQTLSVVADSSATTSDIAATDSSIKEFIVTGANFSFTPNTISVKKGDTVKITFKNADGFHDLRIDEYGVFTQKIGAGAEEPIQFVADKAGSFEYYCSVGSHRQMGMKGTLNVTE